MRYFGSDFLHENTFLRRNPTNARETYNKLICLFQLEQERDPRANNQYVLPLSKRRKRLIKMYWAFKKGESA